MTEPVTEQPHTTADDPPSNPVDDGTHHHHHQPQQPQPPHHPFAPIFTLVNNASTGATHHPHVRYIFSDDDPDLLTRALTDHHEITVDEAGSGPASNDRAVILDLATDNGGGYHVAWASSLSPSWAVLDAQLSRISPPSSDGGNENDGGGGTNSSRPGRLMLRIEGLEGGGLGSESDSRHSQGSGNSGGSGIAQKDRVEGNTEVYPALIDEFEKRMVTLRKVVSASEERRQKVGGESGGEVIQSPQAFEGDATAEQGQGEIGVN
ncbi:hypothetical protein DL766_005502 [Monosporascus sp. MC13-8B]|uniref:Uncharacterized protein n=1 Tax=Monosporascus cannonballus TaxID=155416 RepID=A0ABY0H8T1_9PEZI|nr:hypothetical protein DL763_010362 [Monosporascus cannonballus]RYO87768.1 hypothetical protein DL762_004058 [Monosporascus cannonballus]RYP29215.1 hypothetical protein DL766_005502 [Monosporascus sp. MC13-8B]